MTVDLVCPGCGIVFGTVTNDTVTQEEIDEIVNSHKCDSCGYTGPDYSG